LKRRCIYTATHNLKQNGVSSYKFLRLTWEVGGRR
jgi:hypothetical protein